jgi:hypothetical protein
MAQYTLVTASLIFPAVIGVVLYQAEVRTVLDAQFYVLVSGGALALYVILEFIVGLKYHSLLTVGAAAALIPSVVPAYGLAGFWYSLLSLGASLAFVAAGYRAQIQDDPIAANAYVSSGVIAGLAGFFTLPFTAFEEASGLDITFSFVAVSIVLLGTAIWFSRRWQITWASYYYEARRFAEVSAAIALTVPAFFDAWSHVDDTAKSLIAVLIGLVSLLIASYIRVSAFRLLGIMTLISGLLIWLLVAFTSLSAFWPILLLICGFVLIGLAYGVQRVDLRHFFQRFTVRPEDSLFGLGVPMPVEPVQIAALAPVARKPLSGWTIVGIVLAAIFLVPILFAIFGLFASLLFRSF